MKSLDDEEAFAAVGHGDNKYYWGQRHDRILNESDTGGIAVTRDAMADPAETDISAAQRMLSAVSGSLLTSLLGTFYSPAPSSGLSD